MEAGFPLFCYVVTTRSIAQSLYAITSLHCIRLRSVLVNRSDSLSRVLFPLQSRELDAGWEAPAINSIPSPRICASSPLLVFHEPSSPHQETNREPPSEDGFRRQYGFGSISAFNQRTPR